MRGGVCCHMLRAPDCLDLLILVEIIENFIVVISCCGSLFSFIFVERLIFLVTLAFVWFRVPKEKKKQNEMRNGGIKSVCDTYEYSQIMLVNLLICFLNFTACKQGCGVAIWLKLYKYYTRLNR